jgi:hypothetical protein
MAERVMAQAEHMTTVLLGFIDGTKEFVADTHVHGVRDGSILLAAGRPGAGLDADVVRSVPLAELTFAETCAPGEGGGDEESSGGGTWSMSRDKS